MATTRRLRKRRKGAHRLDLTPLKEALKDRRQWTALAVVIVPDGESEHWALEYDDAGALVDIMVDVETQPEGLELSCRLGGMSSVGALTIPNVGDEVLVCIPSGRIDFAPTITAILSSNELPDPAGQGPAMGRTIIVNSEVLIHDGDGGAEPLPTMAEFKGHTHPSGSGPTGATTDPIPGVGAITGTEVLKVK